MEYTCYDGFSEACHIMVIKLACVKVNLFANIVEIVLVRIKIKGIAV